jgi:hypothetical protein
MPKQQLTPGPLTALPGEKCPYTIKGLKFHKGHDGHGFNLTLCLNGKRVAEVHDDAYGGSYEWHWFDRAQEAELNAYTARLPLYDLWHGESAEYRPKNYKGDAVDCDSFLGALMDAYEQEKEVKRLHKQCATKTIVRMQLDGDNEPKWYAWNKPYTGTLAGMIRAKHGDKVLEILNETIAAGGRKAA